MAMKDPNLCAAGDCDKRWSVMYRHPGGIDRFCIDHWMMTVDTMRDIHDLPWVQLYDQDKEC